MELLLVQIRRGATDVRNHALLVLELRRVSLLVKHLLERADLVSHDSSRVLGDGQSLLLILETGQVVRLLTEHSLLLLVQGLRREYEQIVRHKVSVLRLWIATGLICITATSEVRALSVDIT